MITMLQTLGFFQLEYAGYIEPNLCKRYIQNGSSKFSIRIKYIGLYVIMVMP